MTTRDRTVMIVVALIAALGAAWLLVVSPEREQASKVNAEIASAKAQLETAENEVVHARSAQAQYTKDYASIVNLGKAVPPSQEIPSLIYELAQASGQKAVNFSSISTNASSGSASSSGAIATGQLSAFTPLPFTFVFEGGFFQLERLFRQLADFTTLTGPGQITVDGRLLTVQSLKLAPSPLASSTTGKKVSGMLTGTITATAYVLPASQGLTGGASPSAPAGASPASSAGSSSATTPALVKATVP